MRHPCLLLALVAPLAAAACSDGAGPRAASATTTTSTNRPSTTTEVAVDCPDGDPAPPEAADGTPAEIVAVAGRLTFAVVDRGASVDVVSLYRTVGCELVPLSLAGTAAAFSVGGSVTHGDGIRCDGGEITVLSATSDDGATYRATATTYRVEGGDLVQVAERDETIEAQEDPDGLGAYYRLDC